MSLTRDQYNELMRVLGKRRSDAYIQQSRRQEEVERQIPAVRVYNERAAELSLMEVEAGFGRNGADTAGLRQERRELARKKRELLKNAGFGEDYLDIHYSCMECRDTGYIGNEKCGCFKKLESQLLNKDAGLPARFERENFASFDPYVFDDSEPIEEFLPKRITQYEYMTGSVMDKVRDFIDGFGYDDPQSILMTGPAGTGKTFLSSCIAKTLIDRQHTVVYERAGEMFEMFGRLLFSRRSSEADESRAERVENCELLIIDDLGTEFITEQTRSKLFSLISNRLSAGTSTIISTNLSLNQLSGIYGERVTSRFVGEYILIPFYGTDLREKGGKIHGRQQRAVFEKK
ncbi:MAG: ATP-binding protein [Eubacteriales bacterium]|nr:ATP-binding protein [Eubacteriales bacterium]